VRHPGSDSREIGAALAAQAADLMTVVALLVLKNQRTLPL
jgi:hypothetical protein